MVWHKTAVRWIDPLRHGGNKYGLVCLSLLVFCALQQQIWAQSTSKLNFFLLSDRWSDELETLGEELSHRGHNVVKRSTISGRDVVTSTLIVVDRRYLFGFDLNPWPLNMVALDTDMLLDSDLPTLAVPAPLSQYAQAEVDFKEKTMTRLHNGINRLRFHLSAFGRNRQYKHPLLVVSTSSFVLESARPMPPWLHVVGSIQNWRRLKRVKFVNPAPSKPLLILHLGGPVAPSVVDRALELIDLAAYTLVVATSAPNDVVDINSTLRRKTLHGHMWLENVDLSSFPKVRIIITTGEIRSVTSIILAGSVPVVLSQPKDIYSKEIVVALRRRKLGVGLFEESQRLNETAIWSLCYATMLKAKRALSSPVEVSSLKRAADIIESVAEDPEMVTLALIPDVPLWYQYWFLDVYAVYGMVMVSVFILAGTMASGASALLV